MLIPLLNSSPFLPTHIISNITDLDRKVFKYWEAVKLTVVVQVFQIPNFCLKAQILSLTTIQSVIVLQVSGLLPLFSRKPLSDTQNGIRAVCLPSDQSSGLTQTSAELLFLETTTLLVYAAEVPYACFLLILKRCVLKD